MHPAASLLAAMVRLATGVRVRWQDGAEHDGPRIYPARRRSRT